MYDIIIRNNKVDTLIKRYKNEYRAFSLLNGKSIPLDYESIDSLKLIKLSDDNKYLGVHGRFDVYFDNISGFIHYFKDGIEDINLFIKNNCQKAYLYKRDKEVELTEEKVVRLTLKKTFVINISLVVLEILLCTGQFAVESFVARHAPNLSTSSIYSSFKQNKKLLEIEKEIYYNDDLFNDIFPYYEGTNMNYYLPREIASLEYKYFENEKENLDGYYTVSEPNIIHIRKGISGSNLLNTKHHEFIHMLQNPFIFENYVYLSEASCELIKDEYYQFEENNLTYNHAIINLKLLMEMVGREAIWRLNFSGDDTLLKEFLKSNLSTEKYKRMLELLNTSASENHEEIKDLLTEIYFNIHGTYMLNDPLMYRISYSNFLNYKYGIEPIYNRYYFNLNKMKENKSFYITIIDDLDIYINKYITYEDFKNNTIEDGFVIHPFVIGNIPNYHLILDDEKIIINDIEYTYEEAYDKGLITFIEAKIVKTLSNEEFIYYKENGYKITELDNVHEEINSETVLLPSLEEKFKDKEKTRVYK